MQVWIRFFNAHAFQEPLMVDSNSTLVAFMDDACIWRDQGGFFDENFDDAARRSVIGEAIGGALLNLVLVAALTILTSMEM